MKWLRYLLLFLLLAVLAVPVWLLYNMRDRFPGYSLNLDIPAAKGPVQIQAGFSAVSITPALSDTWTDANGDAAFYPKDGDTYQDVNGNGQFDAFWLAGFDKGRAANGVHDSLWARAMVLDDGHVRVALVVIDAIGFGHDEVIQVRKLIPASLGVTYVSVASTHTHESPDLIGMWGPEDFSSGVNESYRRQVIEGCAKAVEEAVKRMRPAKLRVAQDLTSAIPLVGDTRDPQVMDPGIYLLHAIDSEADTTLGLLFNWANHPETTWADNLLVSSDFPHYVRAEMEKKLGGITVYVNGAIGGLMTTHPGMAVLDLDTKVSYLEPSFEKAEAQGKQLARMAFAALDSAETLPPSPIRLRAATFEVPLDNELFRLAAALRVIERGTSSWMKVRSEVAAWTLGPVSCIHVPGEIYPEIVNGGIESPQGQDFPIAPLETPPLRSQMPGRYRFVFGLANDELGYIIPKSQWDSEVPYTYGAAEQLYGEINSVGPGAAPAVYGALTELIGGL